MTSYGKEQIKGADPSAGEAGTVQADTSFRRSLSWLLMQAPSGACFFQKKVKTQVVETAIKIASQEGICAKVVTMLLKDFDNVLIPTCHSMY